MRQPPVAHRSLRGPVARIGRRALSTLSSLGLAGVMGIAGPGLGTAAAPAATLALAAAARPAQAQGVELATLKTARSEAGALTLEFSARITLPRVVEDALSRGVPVYFEARATLWRNRWYWRDERVNRVSRTWRLAWQPLTSQWRVGLGGLNQTFPTLAEALAAASSSAGWRLAEPGQIDPDSSYYVEFEYRLDTSQLPGPMQFGIGAPGEWVVGVNRTLQLK